MRLRFRARLHHQAKVDGTVLGLVADALSGAVLAVSYAFATFVLRNLFGLTIAGVDHWAQRLLASGSVVAMVAKLRYRGDW